jgi:NAD(P)-dependent dehydrogenase (short-subunit alcohol dehydrogenase family)
MRKIIVITGASSGFGLMTARALAHAGHTVYASMREISGRNAPQVAEAHKFSREHNVDLRKEYSAGPTANLPDVALKGLAALEPADADPAAVAEAIVRVVDTPFGKRPFRVHIDPSLDGAEIVNGVADRVRAELLRRIGLEDILKPKSA